MHPALLRAYDDQLPVLRAGEQLALATAVAMGSATLRKGASEQLWAGLRRQAGLRRATRRVHVSDLGGLAKAVGRSGMGVRVHQRAPVALTAGGGAPGTPVAPEAATGPRTPTGEGG